MDDKMYENDWYYNPEFSLLGGLLDRAGADELFAENESLAGMDRAEWDDNFFFEEIPSDWNHVKAIFPNGVDMANYVMQSIHDKEAVLYALAVAIASIRFGEEFENTDDIATTVDSDDVWITSMDFHFCIKFDVLVPETVSSNEEIVINFDSPNNVLEIANRILDAEKKVNRETE